MKLGFTELPPFMRFRDRHVANDVFYGLQVELMEDPAKGALIRGTGGLRKVRIADPDRGKGKRGGARVIYLHVPEVERIVFVVGFTKNQRDDLSGDERAELKSVVDQIRQQEISAAGRKK